MTYSDPIADMLVRIRNAHANGAELLELPSSKMKGEIARLLKREGYIGDYVTEGGAARKTLRIYLKYYGDHEPCIRGLRRISKSGLRHYVGCDKIPRVLGGMGIAILSTPSGVMTDKDARQQHVGGEVLCYVW